MREAERPFGIKLIFVMFLLNGLTGIYVALFASDGFARGLILDDELLGIIGGFFNNIVFLRILLVVFSAFSLWLSIGVFSQKRSVWYFLLALAILPLITCLLALAALHINNITLENIQKIGIFIRMIINACLFTYVFALQDYFLRD